MFDKAMCALLIVLFIVLCCTIGAAFYLDSQESPEAPVLAIGAFRSSHASQQGGFGQAPTTIVLTDQASVEVYKGYKGFSAFVGQPLEVRTMKSGNKRLCVQNADVSTCTKLAARLLSFPVTNDVPTAKGKPHEH